MLRGSIAKTTVLLLLAATLAAATTTAQTEEEPATPGMFADVGFTVIIEDDADYPLFGFLDIREIAVGEPGNDTLLFRFLPEDITDTNDPMSSIDVFFMTPDDEDHRSGIRANGNPRDSSSQSPIFDFCVIEGDYGYCSHTYENLKVAVGDTITETFAISYINVPAAGTAAQDYAPGGLYVPDGLIGDFGEDYTLVGSTRLAGTGQLSLEAPETTNATAEPGGAAEFSLEITNRANATAEFHLNASGLPPGFDATFNPQHGNVSANGTATSNLTVRVPDGSAEGEVNFTVMVETSGDANATLNLTLTVSGAAGPPPTTGPPTNRTNATATPTGNATGNETGSPQGTEDEGAIPGLEAALIVGALAATAWVARRRTR